MLTLEHPKLRSDLRVSQQGVADDATVVVKDPATGRFFRLRQAEQFIAQQLDGSAPLDVIKQRFEQKFGAPLAPETLKEFVEHLRRLGLLETESSRAGYGAGPRRTFRGNLLYLRLKAFDPDRLLDRLVKKLGFFFTPSFLVFSAALIFFAFAIAIVNSGEIGHALLHLYRFQILLVAWLTIFAVTTAHEFAHGLTCKRFGGEVHEMGVLLIYLQLAFYCNVSDAWLFPEKSKRLWVTFAGPYFEIFLWALAVLTWRVTDPETWVNSLALVVIATSGIKLLINLNPLIKLDGYYLLSDCLEVPNLRQKSFSYLGARLGQLWRSATRGIEDATPRERRIYLVYGLLAGAYSFWLLGFVVVQFGSFLIGRYQGVGFLLLAGLLVTVFRNPLKKVLPKRESLASINRRTTCLVLLVLLLASVVLVRMELRVAGGFTILPIQNADVRAQIEGVIEKVQVDEGDLVREGDLIARLSDRDSRVELKTIEARIDEKRARLKMFKVGPRPEEIALARSEVEAAKTRQEHAWRRSNESGEIHAAQRSKAETAVQKADERLKYARNDLARFRALFQAELVSRKQIEEVEERVAMREREVEEAQAELRTILADDLAQVRKDLAVAEKEVEVAEGRLKVLLAGTRREEIEATEAEIAGLEAQRGYLQEQLALVRVVSPVSGVITTPKPKEKTGDYVKKGDLIAEVHELKTVKAEIAISEKEIADVRVGQRVVLRARGYPETSFVGRVTAIAPAAIEEKQGLGERIVRVTTTIDNPSLLLKPEMTGNAKISCGQRRIVELLTRRVARYIRVEFWSWW